VKPHALDPTHAQGRERPFGLEATEAALDGRAAPVEALPAQRLARDQGMEAVGSNPHRRGLAFAGRAAPLRCLPVVVRACEAPLAMWCPEPPEPLDGEARHYAGYAIEDPGARFQAWRERKSVAEWADVEMPRLSEATKPGSVWLALREAHVSVDGSLAGQPYALRLIVGAPTGGSVAPAKILKPLVDGVIAALHVHDGSAIAALGDRLAHQCSGVSAKHVRELLTEETAAVLGERRLVWPRAHGVQWNPADDLCVALELLTVPSDRVQLAGRLCAVSANGQREQSGWRQARRVHG
jgi:hypothetical protein